MSTMPFIKSDNLMIAENYYNVMLAKDFAGMAKFLASDIHFVSPFGEMHGKEAVVSAAKSFGGKLQCINIRSRFANDIAKQIMFAYDMTVPEPIGKFRAAVLMEFTGNLISKIELFYDARPFANF